jgi:hypothetical protein
MSDNRYYVKHSHALLSPRVLPSSAPVWQCTRSSKEDEYNRVHLFEKGCRLADSLTGEFIARRVDISLFQNHDGLVLALRDEMQPSAFAWHDEDAWTT